MARRIIQVRFLQDKTLGAEFSAKEYSYFTDDPDVKKDDWCVVVVSGCPRIVKVTRTEGLSVAALQAATKWIAQRVNMEEYEARAARQEKVKEIENKLDALIAQHNRYQIFQSYASLNPDIAALLDEVRRLDPTLLSAPAPASEGTFCDHVDVEFPSGEYELKDGVAVRVGNEPPQEPESTDPPEPKRGKKQTLR